MSDTWGPPTAVAIAVAPSPALPRPSKRMLRLAGEIRSAQSAALIARAVSFSVIIAVAVALGIFASSDRFDEMRADVGWQVILTAAVPVSMAGILFVSSFFLSMYAARLELDLERDR